MCGWDQSLSVTSCEGLQHLCTTGRTFITATPQQMELQWPPSAPSLFPALTSFLRAVLSMRINKDCRGISLCLLPHWQFYTRWVWAIQKKKKTPHGRKVEHFQGHIFENVRFYTGRDRVFYRHPSFFSGTYRQHFTRYSLLKRSEAFYLLAEMTGGCSEKYIILLYLKIMAEHQNSLPFAFFSPQTHHKTYFQRS